MPPAPYLPLLQVIAVHSFLKDWLTCWLPFL